MLHFFNCVGLSFQHQPASKLMRNTQNCNYQFDNKGKHIMTAMCTERHIYMPFAHK